MWFRSLIDALKTRPSRKSARPSPRPRPSCQPRVEALEDRIVFSFSPAVTYPGGFSPEAVATGDFNGDGHLDLVAGNYDAPTVIMFGNGDGTFQPATSYPAAAWATSLAVGDLNGDGKLDLAVTGGDDNVRVLFGNGDGSLQPATSVSLGGYLTSVSVADFNADGKLDLGVIANVRVSLDDYDEYFEGFAHVLLGDGHGNFSAANTTWLGVGVYIPFRSAAVADVNNDGAADLSTTNYDYWEIAVLLNDGDGHFQAPTTFRAGYWPDSLAAGDINADGKIDLATNNRDTDAVLYFLGDGIGGFGPPQTLGTGDYPDDIFLADFTDDDQLDLATANLNDDTLSVFPGRGDGTFLPRLTVPAGDTPGALAAGDFNGDGWLDAAAANRYAGTVSVLVNDHDWPRADEPVISIQGTSVPEGNAGTTNATFTVSLSKPWGQPVTVEYYTATSDAATPGVDYEPVSGTLTFAPGQTSLTAEVPVYGDRTAEGGELFSVWLRNPSNATIETAYGYMGINEDEPAFRIVEQQDVSVTEGNSGITHVLHYTVQKSNVYDIPVTVTYGGGYGSASPGSDYQTGGTLTFAPGELSKTIDVTIYGDRIAEESVYWDYDPGSETYRERVERHEYFSVALTAGDYGRIVGGQPAVYIQDDDDKPRISISDVTQFEGKRGQTTLFTFTVTLSAAYEQPVTMSYRTVNGTATTSNNDYVAKTGTLTFAPGETTKTITIEVKGDSKKEASETFYLDLFDLSSNALFTKSRGLGTILNDD